MAVNRRVVIKEYARTIVSSVLLALVLVVFVAQSFVVNGSSMEPTLHDGERLIVEKISYLVREPQRGDIIVFHPPISSNHPFIKRVIGLPGDTVEARDHQLLVNGLLITEEYLSESMQGNFGPITVPTDSVFVLGDNRNRSYDSRYNEVGCIPYNDVIGRALLRYWPPLKSGTMGGATTSVSND